MLFASFFNFVDIVYAPTFGYGTAGTAGSTLIHRQMVGSVFTIAVNAKAYSVSASLAITSMGDASQIYINAAIYRHSDSTKVAEASQNVYTATFTKAWKRFTFSTMPSLTAGTEYVLDVLATSDYTDIPPTVYVYYDAGDTNQGHYEIVTSFPDTASFTHNNNKYSVYCTYNIVSTSTAVRAVSYPFQRKTFFAATRFWVFYVDSSYIKYRTSTDGITWSDATTIRYGGIGHYISIWFDGTYLHYAATQQSANYALFYRRGTPNSDGTITWSANEQNAAPANSTIIYYTPFVSVDSDGYPWIGYQRRVPPGPVYYPHVTKSSTNDGTWTTATDFPYQLSTTSNSGWRVSIIPLTQTKMYAVYATDGPAGLGKLWTGSWGDEETTMSLCEDAWGHSIVAQGDDLHIAFNHANTHNIMYNKRTYGSGWGETETTVQATSLITMPVLTIDTSTNNLYCFWQQSPTLNHIYYKKCVSGTWDTDPTDWIDESADGLQSSSSPYGDCFTSFYQSYGNYIGLVYLTGSASPYHVIFAYLEISVGEEYERSATQSINLALAITRTTELLKTASQTITFSLVSSRLIEVTQTVTQLINIGLATSRILESVRAATQTISFTIQGIGEKFGLYFREATLTLTLTLNGERLVEILKTASQTITFSLQAIAEITGLFSRTASLIINVAIASLRQIDVTRPVSQAINLALTGVGTIVTEFERAASLVITLSSAVMGLFGESISMVYGLAGLAFIIAIAALALVLTKKD